MLWPFVEPYMAIGAIAPTYQGFLDNKNDLDWLGITFDELFDYSMFLIKLGFFNVMDPFQDNGYTLIPEMPEIERPSI